MFFAGFTRIKDNIELKRIKNSRKGLLLNPYSDVKNGNRHVLHVLANQKDKCKIDGMNTEESYPKFHTHDKTVLANLGLEGETWKYCQYCHP